MLQNYDKKKWRGRKARKGDQKKKRNILAERKPP